MPEDEAIDQLIRLVGAIHPGERTWFNYDHRSLAVVAGGKLVALAADENEANFIARAPDLIRLVIGELLLLKEGMR